MLSGGGRRLSSKDGSRCLTLRRADLCIILLRDIHETGETIYRRVGYVRLGGSSYSVNMPGAVSLQVEQTSSRTVTNRGLTYRSIIRHLVDFGHRYLSVNQLRSQTLLANGTPMY